MLLKGMGFPEVFTAKSGIHGLSLVEKHAIEFVVVAWDMIGLPGTTFVQKARAKRRRKYLPCVLYSKNMGGGDAQLIKELGFQDVLSMPFDKATARALIQKVVDREANLDPIEITLRRIESLIAESRLAEAMKCITPRLDQRGPVFARAQTVVAEAWMQIGRLDLSEGCLHSAIDDSPGYAPAMQLIARMLSQKGQHGEAIAMLERMSKNSPKNMSMLVGLGAAYVNADRHDEATQVFDRVLKMDSDNQSAKDEMGKLAFKDGNMILAAKLLAGTENGNEISRYFNNLAVSLVGKGAFLEAIETYQNAINLLANKAQIHLLHYNLGLAYRKRGDNPKALANLCTSYIHDPTYEKAYVAIARLVNEMKEKGEAYDRKLTGDVKTIRDRFLSGQPKSAAKQSA